LVQNILRNGVEKIIFPLNIPLSRKLSLAEFNYANLHEGSALHAFGEAVDYKGDTFVPTFKQISISVSIDELPDKFTFTPPTAIKLDVDGIELDILKGARKTLTRSSFRTLLVEATENRDADQICSLVAGYGLGIKSVHRSHLTSNYIFTRA